MGALFDIGEGADGEIKEKLNKAFSGKRLARLQDHFKYKETVFDGTHRLERFCARAKLHPAGARAKGKWYFLLKRILPQATDGTVDGAGRPVMTTDAIKAALTKALDFDRNGITRVVFEAEEQSGARAHFIHPKNNAPGIQIGKTLNIILVCPAPLNDGELDTLPQDPDQGEQELPDVSTTPARRAKKNKAGKKAKAKPAKKNKSGKKAKAKKKG